MDTVAPPATCPCGGSSHVICRRDTARASITSSVHLISHLLALETPSRVALAFPLSRETFETHLRRRDRRLHPLRARPASTRRDDRDDDRHHHHHHRARASRRPRARHRGVTTPIIHRQAPRGPTTSRRRHPSSRARRRVAASDARRPASSPSRASSFARSREPSRCRVGGDESVERLTARCSFSSFTESRRARERRARVSIIAPARVRSSTRRRRRRRRPWRSRRPCVPRARNRHPLNRNSSP